MKGLWGAGVGLALWAAAVVVGMADENSAGGAVPANGYTVADLGAGSVVWDMNGSGLCVGTKDGAGKLWSVTPTNVTVLQSFGTNFTPTAVCDGGSVVGNDRREHGIYYLAGEGYAVRHRIATNAAMRGLSLWTCSTAVRAAGVRKLPESQGMACAWRASSGLPLTLGFVTWTNPVRASALSSVAYASNNRGWVVGMSYDKKAGALLRHVPVAWIPRAELGLGGQQLKDVYLPWPEFIKGYEDTARLAPYAVNNGVAQGGVTSVWIVGYFDFARVNDYDNKFLPVLWKVTTTGGVARASVSGLGKGLKFEGANPTWAPKGHADRMGTVYQDVNDAGVIVGYSVRRGDGNGRSCETTRLPVAGLDGFAFVRDAGGYRDLNDLIGTARSRWSLRQAMRINNSGWIAVNAVKRVTAVSEDGEETEELMARACVLIPNP